MGRDAVRTAGGLRRAAAVLGECSLHGEEETKPSAASSKLLFRSGPSNESLLLF